MSFLSGATAHGLLGRDLRVIAIDDAYAEMIGHTHEQVVGRCPLDLTHPDDRAGVAAFLDRALACGEPMTTTKRYLRGDGSSLWVCVQVSRVGVGDATRLVVSCTRLARNQPAVSAVEAQWRMAGTLLAALNAGKRVFGSSLLSNPATEVLLTLYLAEAEARPAIAGAVAEDTDQSWALASRWLQALMAEGHVETERPGPVDPATPLRLTPRALILVESILSSLTVAPDEVASAAE